MLNSSYTPMPVPYKPTTNAWRRGVGNNNNGGGGYIFNSNQHVANLGYQRQETGCVKGGCPVGPLSGNKPFNHRNR